ncbi:MAG: transcriptional regulator [Bradyrhizobiaceae bacterium]|nr:transcriptional regulator [Bradyrhizobiaceae bacterium]
MTMTASASSAREAAPDRERLALRLRALAHPARLRILAALAESNTCHCGDIVRDLPLAQSTVSEHLRILKEAGFVRGGTDGGRACYCLDRSAVEEVAADFDRLLAAMAGRKARKRKART